MIYWCIYPLKFITKGYIDHVKEKGQSHAANTKGIEIVSAPSSQQHQIQVLGTFWEFYHTNRNPWNHALCFNNILYYVINYVGPSLTLEGWRRSFRSKKKQKQKAYKNVSTLLKIINHIHMLLWKFVV